MYSIKTDLEDKTWTDFVIDLNKNTFLHSLEWAKFNSKTNKVWKLGLFEDQKLISVALVIKIVAKRGTFLLVPHGPQYATQDFKEQQIILKEWLNYLKNLGKTEQCNFIRIQPIVLKNQTNQELFNLVGCRPAPIHVHTELSSVVEIQEESEMLLKMRKTTRQVIKKAQKMLDSGELVLEFPTQILPEMHQVYQDTYKRGGAVAYQNEYIDREWEVFSKNQNAKMFAVYYQQKLISWGMVLICGKRAFYHQGGNILVKNVPASYLMQWNGIKFASQKGCVSYDFWGVSPEDKPNHPWANISLFKRGFGGQDVALLHAQDYILDWKYWFNWIIEWQRARKRGF
jgi:lipid II:glycine glycyltransferase (peptidoglycan interpeptide bridge formation enzyme)